MTLLLNKLLHFFFPQQCILCERKSLEADALCTVCRQNLPLIGHACQRCGINLSAVTTTLCGQCLQHPIGNHYAIIPFYYQPPIDYFIRQLKFGHQFFAARILANLIFPHLEKFYSEHPPWPEMILPVPLHLRRLKERGFNQSLEICKLLNQKIKGKIDSQSCIRIKNTLPQASLQGKERQKNMQRAFLLQKPFASRHIAIFDDVVTTTATLRTLLKTLKLSTQVRVDVWAVARATGGATADLPTLLHNSPAMD